MNKKLPIGIQTFENLIREGYYYVDKTRFLQELAFEGKYYFLSRPRRFGKSLFLSTIKSAFEGKKICSRVFIWRITGTGPRYIRLSTSVSAPG